jgi:thioredoxin-related protein
MKRNRIILVALAAVFIGSSAFVLKKKAPAEKTEGIEWLSIEEAYAKNEKKPRKIFIDVYTDWCGWCKVMDKKTFTDANVVEYVNKNYYAVKLNAESMAEVKLGEVTTTEAGIAQAFRVNSYPTIVFLEKDFQTYTPQSGFREAPEFLSLLKAFKEKETAKN